MSGVSPIVSRGFDTYGSIPLIVTRGYGIGAPPVPTFGVVTVTDVPQATVTVEDEGMGVYDIGSQARLIGTFADEAGDPANPSGVSVIIRAPDGTTTTVSASQQTTGIWFYVLSLSQAGIYYYRFVGSGALIATGDGYLTVNDSVPLQPFPPVTAVCC